MDVDVNRPIPQIQMYEIADVRFLGASPVQMIADKLSAISTDKVFRRIKDVVDMIYRGVRMKDETEKKKAQRDVLKAVCIASGTILLIAGIIVVARKVGIR